MSVGLCIFSFNGLNFAGVGEPVIVRECARIPFHVFRRLSLHRNADIYVIILDWNMVRSHSLPRKAASLVISSSGEGPNFPHALACLYPFFFLKKKGITICLWERHA